MPAAVVPGRGFSLASLDLDRALADKTSYEAALDKAQVAMLKVEQAYSVGGLRGIVLFEGWDGGGKGGAIQRLTARLDPRWVHVTAIGANRPRGSRAGIDLWPVLAKRCHLPRPSSASWQRPPQPGICAGFDRSWFERVRIERTADPGEATWRRAYREINEFERMLVDDGVRVVKLFLHVSAKEQLKRLAERIEDPVKHWKIAPDDIRNYARRDDYIDASERDVRRNLDRPRRRGT